MGSPRPREAKETARGQRASRLLFSTILLARPVSGGRDKSHQQGKSRLGRVGQLSEVSGPLRKENRPPQAILASLRKSQLLPRVATRIHRWTSVSLHVLKARGWTAGHPGPSLRTAQPGTQVRCPSARRPNLHLQQPPPRDWGPHASACVCIHGTQQGSRGRLRFLSPRGPVGGGVAWESSPPPQNGLRQRPSGNSSWARPLITLTHK